MVAGVAGVMSDTGPGPAAPARSILVVDDDLDILESLEMVLSALPRVKVFTASSGADALEILRREDIGLILTDYKMPGMNGAELLLKATEIAPNVRRAMVSAFPEAFTTSRLRPTDLAFFLRKPIEPNELLTRAIEVLGS